MGETVLAGTLVSIDLVDWLRHLLLENIILSRNLIKIVSEPRLMPGFLH